MEEGASGRHCFNMTLYYSAGTTRQNSKMSACQPSLFLPICTQIKYTKMYIEVLGQVITTPDSAMPEIKGANEA
jgi:hypothetical protein